MSYSRYMSAPHLARQNANYSEWLPYFFRSKIGIFMFISLIYSFSNLIINSYKTNKIFSALSITLSLSNAITIIIVLLFFPPDLRFYSWLLTVFFFMILLNFANQLSLILNYSYLLFAISCIVFFISGPSIIYLNYEMPNVKNIDKGTSSFYLEYVPKVKWLSRMNEVEGKIPVRIPEYHFQCWNITPPCTGDLPSVNLLNPQN